MTTFILIYLWHVLFCYGLWHIVTTALLHGLEEIFSLQGVDGTGLGNSHGAQSCDERRVWVRWEINKSHCHIQLMVTESELKIRIWTWWWMVCRLWIDTALMNMSCGVWKKDSWWIFSLPHPNCERQNSAKWCHYYRLCKPAVWPYYMGCWGI